MTDTAYGVWRDASHPPKMHTETYTDFDDTEVDYELSDAVLVITRDREFAVAKCCYDECGKLWWFSDDGVDLKVTHWQPLPVEMPEAGPWPD